MMMIGKLKTMTPANLDEWASRIGAPDASLHHICFWIFSEDEPVSPKHVCAETVRWLNGEGSHLATMMTHREAGYRFGDVVISEVCENDSTMHAWSFNVYPHVHPVQLASMLEQRIWDSGVSLNAIALAKTSTHQIMIELLDS